MTKLDKFAIQKKLETGLALQQDNQLEAAMTLFEEILKTNPEQVDALHGIGMIFAQKRDYHCAVPYLEKAVDQAPHIAEFHNNLGNAYKAIGKIEKAMQHYRAALRLKSPYPEAYNNLGGLLYKIGHYSEATQALQKAIRMNPTSVESHYNLANCYVQQDKLLEAITHFQEVLKHRPDHLGALHNLGIALCALKRFEEAEPLLAQVIQREPTNIDALFHLGVIYSSLAQADKAKECYLNVLAIDPQHANSHHNLATIFLHLHQSDLALKHYKEALRLQPENKTAQHMIDALSGKTQATGAPFEYTRALFDQYAYSYDSQVKNELKYQVPYLLRTALTPFVTVSEEPWEVLDLGCGTGLCAPFFSDIAGKLTGVDVSLNMTEVARLQGGYHKLYVMDALSFLKQHKSEYNLIISADVFVYFGSLEEIFSECYTSLKPLGYFIFSIETLTNEESESLPSHTDFQLRKTGRYAHSSEYIHVLAKKFNYQIILEQNEILRTQDTAPVYGNIYILKKTA